MYKKTLNSIMCRSSHVYERRQFFKPLALPLSRMSLVHNANGRGFPVEVNRAVGSRQQWTVKYWKSTCVISFSRFNLYILYVSWFTLKSRLRGCWKRGVQAGEGMSGVSKIVNLRLGSRKQGLLRAGRCFLKAVSWQVMLFPRLFWWGGQIKSNQDVR